MIPKMIQKKKKDFTKPYDDYVLIDLLKSVLVLASASAIGFCFKKLDFADANIITVFVLAVLIISIVTAQRVYSLVFSIISVLLFNFLFTEPCFTLHVYDDGYPMTFLIMFIVAFLSGTLALQLKSQAEQSERVAFRTRILFETNQLLQQAEGYDKIISATAKQLIKLTGRDVVFYPVKEKELGIMQRFSAGISEGIKDQLYEDERERTVATWVMKNNRRAGATTEIMPDARCMYLAIRVNQKIYGVVGIEAETEPIDSFESSILLSIIGECAFALENEKINKEKEDAAVQMQNEKLRADLLRAISHDLRTPLTSISGNASNLLANEAYFDEETRKRLYMDIYDDSMWLIGLVENLLSVTRLEEGRMNLNISVELVEEVIEEALKHVNRKKNEHCISVEQEEEFLLARMDPRLIVQVVINIVDNAIKYTQEGSNIWVKTYREDRMAVITIADDGPGISDEGKRQVFEMFYTGTNKIADSHRSLGLGLALCKSIVNAHGGEITVYDRKPKGTVFEFTLPAGEVHIHE